MAKGCALILLMYP